MRHRRFATRMHPNDATARPSRRAPRVRVIRKDHRMRIRTLLGLLAFSVLPATVAAQGGCPGLPAGSTVRLHAASAATYTLPQAVQPADSAILLPSGAAGAGTIRCADLRRVQLRVGHRSRGRAALKGAGFGLLIGGVIGAGLGYAQTEEETEGDGWQIFSPEEGALIGAVFLGGASAVVGGAIGFVAPGSRWEDVRVPARAPRASAEGLRIAPAGRGQVRVSYTLPL